MVRLLGEAGCEITGTAADANGLVREVYLIHDAPEHLGYLLKDRVDDVEVVLDALTRVIAGECVVDPTIVGSCIATANIAGSRLSHPGN